MSSRISFQQIIKTALSVFSLKILFLLVGFVGTVWLTRYFGAQNSGIYFWLLSTLAILTVVVRKGQENQLLKGVSSLSNEGALVFNQAKSVLFRHAIAQSVPLCAVLLLLLLVCYFFLPQVHIEQHAVLICLFVMLPTNLLLTLCAFALQGEQKAKAQLILTSLPRVLIFIFLPLWLLFNAHAALADLLVASIISFICSCLLALYLLKYFGYQLLRSSLGQPKTSKDVTQTGQFYWVSLSAVLMAEASIVLLGILSDPKHTAYYAIAVRLVTITSFILQAFNSVLAPNFAKLHATGSHAELISLFQRARIVSSVISLVVMCVLFVFAKPILNVFGAEFSDASSVLRVLLIAHFCKVLVGSVGQLLLMSGYVVYQRRALWCGLAVLLGLSCVLIPLWGALGAAIAMLAAVALNNGLGLWFAHQQLAVPLGFSYRAVCDFDDTNKID